MGALKRINDTGILALPIMLACGYCVAWLLGLFAGVALT